MPTSAQTESVDFPEGWVEAIAGWSRRQRYLVAVSGGLDSVVLLDLLRQSGFRHLTVCHLNHGLRGRASAADYRFVKQLAGRNGLAFYGGRVDANQYASETRQSLEAAARELRYWFFAEAARATRCGRLILAHHADDQIETCLFQFFRGSGARGLAGMRASHKRTIGTTSLTLLRPLLEIPRDLLSTYQRSRNLTFRKDASNDSLEPTRNRIRLQLLPEIDRIYGRGWRQSVRRAARILREEDAWMDAHCIPPNADGSLTVKSLIIHPLALQRRSVLRWLRSQRVADAGFREVEAVLSLCGGATAPAKVNLPGNRHARRRRGLLFLE